MQYSDQQSYNAPPALISAPPLQSFRGGHSGRQGQQSQQPRACYTYGDMGHIARFCPRVSSSSQHQGSRAMVQAPEQYVLHLPDTYSGVIEINAPRLKSLDYKGSVWFISLKIVPLLAQLSLALRGGYILDAKSHYTRLFESFCALEHLHLDNHSVKLLAAGAGEVPTSLPFRVDCVKNLYLFDLYLSELYSVSCALCLIRSFPYLKYIEIKVDDSGVPMALDNIDLKGSFGDTTLNNLSIIVIKSIRGTNPHMQ
ncbi:uncharacterized protein [Nicotiana sylvestris]|uniref:uncharacterized protein n=1 Tax=Nicotiana sylvestris TaxID=4096 RepID=UPI00388C8C96